jgi:prepilin-type processing-associated H-X9-DG protein
MDSMWNLQRQIYEVQDKLSERTIEDVSLRHNGRANGYYVDGHAERNDDHTYLQRGFGVDNLTLF